MINIHEKHTSAKSCVFLMTLISIFNGKIMFRFECNTKINGSYMAIIWRHIRGNLLHREKWTAQECEFKLTWNQVPGLLPDIFNKLRSGLLLLKCAAVFFGCWHVRSICWFVPVEAESMLGVLLPWVSRRISTIRAWDPLAASHVVWPSTGRFVMTATRTHLC